MDLYQGLKIGLATILLLPLMASLFLATCALFEFRFSDQTLTLWSNRILYAMTLIAFCSLCLFASSNQDPLIIHFGHWQSLGGFDIHLELLVDWVSMACLALATLITATVGNFSERYLSKDSGLQRFVIIMGMFSFGINLIFLAANLNLLIIGWECVGIASVLLIAYFVDRVEPVQNSIWALVSYRICDVGLITFMIIVHSRLHHSSLPQANANGDLLALIQQESWSVLGLLLIWAAMGKAAQFPLTNWLPRAMEGPTPSSAIFYGALSIHAPVYLLIRMNAVVTSSALVATLLGCIGGLTALYASLCGRVRSDVKTNLAYASVAQVGIMFVELSMGWTTFALIHMLSHATLRTLQFLSAPSALQYLDGIQRSGHDRMKTTQIWFGKILPSELSFWIYRHSLLAWHLEKAVLEFILKPLEHFATFTMYIEAGLPSRQLPLESTEVPAPSLPSIAKITALNERK